MASIFRSNYLLKTVRRAMVSESYTCRVPIQLANEYKFIRTDACQTTLILEMDASMTNKSWWKQRGQVLS